MILRLCFLSLFFSLVSPFYSQDIPISTENEALYEFIDELAASHFISVNQIVKPFTQKQVNDWMHDAEPFYSSMTRRQQEEWQFYKDNILWHKQDSVKLSNRIDISKGDNPALSLSPLGFYSRNDNVSLAIKPLLEAQFYMNGNGMIYHRTVGGIMELAVDNWSFYASIQGSAELERLSDPDFLVNRRGANYKQADFSDALGGITYSNDWMSLGLVKDYVEWGTNQNGANIISDVAPSFAQIKLKIKPVEWFEFNYIHGFLVSDVIDSTESYVASTGDRREVMHGKFIAANMFTVYPIKTLALSAGNSIVYSAGNMKPQFLNPMMFYKSVDHTYNSTDDVGSHVGQNSQMFIEASFRGIKNVFIYGTLFIDELRLERLKHPDEFNLYSYKAGIKATQIISNTSFGFEYTHSTPVTYQHYMPTTTFESNSYNMGHYLRDNADEFYTYVHYRPIKNLRFKLSYTHIRKGEEYGYVDFYESVVHPFMEEVKYENVSWELMSEYQLAYDMFFNLRLVQSNATGEDMEKYVAPHFQGKNFTVMIGANIGF